MKRTRISTGEARMRNKRRAFSLLELLVVVSIMAILAAVAVPAIKALTQNNNQKQARNMVSAYIAAARSAAMQQRCLVGVVFFEDQVNRNQTAIRIVRDVPKNSAWGNTSDVLSVMSALPGSKAEYLPRGIRVGVLDDNTTWSIRTEQQNNTSKRSRIILFDGNGQMVLRNGLTTTGTYSTSVTYNPGEAVVASSEIYVCARTALNQSPTTAGSTYWRREDWGLRAIASSVDDGVSSPGIVVWDANELDAQGFAANDDAGRGAWVLKNADVLFVNAYTGNLIDALR